MAKLILQIDIEGIEKQKKEKKMLQEEERLRDEKFGKNTSS